MGTERVTRRRKRKARKARAGAMKRNMGGRVGLLAAGRAL